MRAPHWPMLVLALLLLGAAAAQAFGGWPHVRAELLLSGVDADTVGAVGAGWLFSSALLAALAGLCIAIAVRRDARVGAAALGVATAVVFVVFGALGLWLRGNTHYGYFIAVGAMAALLAWRSSVHARNAPSSAGG